jgi:starch synthase (maltosyl-transferring)
MNEDGRRRVVIEGVTPLIDGGRFPIKRTVGESVLVDADIFADGHDLLAARLLFRKQGSSDWSEVAMKRGVNDRWSGAFTVEEEGVYLYMLQAWVDRFLSLSTSWRGQESWKV